MPEESVNEGNKNVEEAEDKSHPESVPWSQYVGLKEKFNKSETKFGEQVSSLEEQLRNAPNAEEFTKIKGELGTLTTKHQEVSDELKGIKDKTVTDKKATLVSKGVSEEEMTDMSEKELDVLIKAIGSFKSKALPDLGNGGGGGVLIGTPMQLAQKAYSK